MVELKNFSKSSERFQKPSTEGFFYVFWKLEEREEEKNLGTKAVIPISGSERAIFIETIVSDLSNRSSLNILDLGTAYGQNLFILRKLVKPNLLVGLDININRLIPASVIAKEKNINNINFIASSSLVLPFRDNSFNLVIVSALFLYLDDESLITTLKEISRITSDRIIILEQHLEGSDSILLKGEVTGGSFWLRDYNKFFNKSLTTNFNLVEHKIKNPRWQIEKWENTGRVFEIKLNKEVVS